MGKNGNNEDDKKEQPEPLLQLQQQVQHLRLQPQQQPQSEQQPQAEQLLQLQQLIEQQSLQMQRNMAEITALRQQVRDMKGQHAGLMPQHQPPQPHVLPQPQATQPQPYEYQPHQSQLAGLYAPEQPSFNTTKSEDKWKKVDVVSEISELLNFHPIAIGDVVNSTPLQDFSESNDNSSDMVAEEPIMMPMIIIMTNVNDIQITAPAVNGV
ncbi:hydroxysteroid dehydrogenase-like protein 2 [Osmia bicornis bicornis]|uniref:hydroxysteroid dehydrogenase-like protein 2 n=1 Tax=Osmia bicornis bicornis TaxID=1437191 RepID=UPI001EAF63B5|nr:hydroxysteroid dehydrogenase-like protein 2 [Osmia bicornis bicornis]